MFREREFQNKVFDALDHYLEVLSERKANADEVAKIKADKPDIDIPIPDFCEEAFVKLRDDGLLPPSRATTPFSPRTDGIGQPVPNVTLKVPTGGGKTWLAVKSASKILNNYLGLNHGFVLWIVPNEAIYSQTLRNFRNRDHPYRQALDRAAAGRVKILTKADRLNARDVASHLCVMVLMLQSANRQTKDALRMFRDRGDVHGFVPPEGDQVAQQQLHKAVPNLDAYGGNLMTHIKESLGNALRIVRPVVVMDEGHKAIADLAFKTLYGFNPSFVLELTATPKDVLPRGGKNPQSARYANLLVEITGLELEAEEMIKMPLVLDPRKGTDWKATLNAAVEKLNGLQADADTLRANVNRYIRPILLVQVERTGKDQRDGNYIHAADVQEWLLQTGFTTDQVAIKTADQNDLKSPENQNLLSPSNRVRVIITKEALQEGWDCPFAYVLCALASRSNLNAMTQLVGRILRQPGAEKTGVDELDKCYVFTHQSETRDLIEAIKGGLEKDGLGDLVLEVATDSQTSSVPPVQKIKRRDKFKDVKIYLPKILVNREGVLGPLDYETDILAKIDWHNFDPSTIAKNIHLSRTPVSNQIVEVGLVGASGETFVSKLVERLPELTRFDPVLAVQKISDIILNPFVGREIVGKLIAGLKKRGFDDLALGFQSSRITEELRKGLRLEQDRQAEAYFKKSVTKGDIQFRLRADGNNWEMPKTLLTSQAQQAYQVIGKDGGIVKKSLFERVYQTEFNFDEREVAVYLDEQAALGWWHRNVAKKHYGLQGWRKGSIYPDFIFSVGTNNQASKLVVLEMKGEHLAGNQNTAYKKAVMKLLTENFDLDKTHSVGQLELETDGQSVVCDLVLLDTWRNELPNKHFSDAV